VDQSLEDLEPRALVRAHPLLELGFGASRRLTLPEHLRRLFEVVSRYDRGVPAHQSGETALFGAAQVPGVLQQRVETFLSAQGSAGFTRGWSP